MARVDVRVEIRAAGALVHEQVFSVKEAAPPADLTPEQAHAEAVRERKVILDAARARAVDALTALTFTGTEGHV